MGRITTWKAPQHRSKSRFIWQIVVSRWGPTPTYPPEHFKRKYRLPLGLFNEILEKVQANDDHFRQRKYATGKLGLSALQKVAASIRILATGTSAHDMDDRYRMGASTALESLKRFCKSVINIYEDTALRSPTEADLNRLLDEGNRKRLPGCIGSLDCMHWSWKNCPSAWKGMFQGKEKEASVVLETICDQSRRFWHFNFGSPGSLNDINIIERSQLFFQSQSAECPLNVNFNVNGRSYYIPYWLVDGIYPTYACFLKSIQNPRTRMEQFFATLHEAIRKEIECAFGILQGRFHILTTGCRLWDRDAMGDVMKACVILHNLIIDYEKEHAIDSNYIEDDQYRPEHPFTMIKDTEVRTSSVRSRYIRAMQSETDHNRLQADVVHKVWNRWSRENEEENGGEEDN